MRSLTWPSSLGALLLLVTLIVVAGSTDDSCRAVETIIQDEWADETSLLHLTSMVNQRGVKHEPTDSEVAAAHPLAEPLGHKQHASMEGTDVQDSTVAAGAQGQSEHLQPLGKAISAQRAAAGWSGSTLLQVFTSLHRSDAHNGERLLATEAARQTHMLAYVILFGIVMILLGFGMIVLAGMKKEDEMYYQQRDSFTPPRQQTPASAARVPAATQPSAPRTAYFSRSSNSSSNGPLPSSDSLAGSRLQTMAGNPITQSPRPAPGTGQLCPELAGATVPAKSKFPMRVPLLHNVNAEDSEHALVRSVRAKDGTPMFNLKLTRSKASEVANQPQEYLALSLPEEEQRELALCAFGRPYGHLECHIYQLGQEPWGIIREEAGAYTIYLKNNTSALTAFVQGSGANRTVRIVQSQNREIDVAIAVARIDGPRPEQEYYEVECYPHCDIILAIIMLGGIDRMSVDVPGSLPLTYSR